MSQSLGRVMGIDYGDRRVGVAISDEGRMISQALATLQRQRRGDQALTQEISLLLLEHEVTQVVVGWPLRLNGREGIQTQKVDRFITQLTQVTSLPICRWDERLTTTSAERALREGGVKGKRRRDKVDQVAAALILQSWLDAESVKRSATPTT